MSQFEKWFKAQFGALPLVPEERHRLAHEASELRQKVATLEQRLQADETVSHQWTVALYARQAAGTGFSF